MTESTTGQRGASTQAKDEARRHADEAKDQARSVLDEQKRTTADQIGGAAKAAQRTADELSNQDQEVAAGYAHQAAEALEQFAGTLRDRDLDSLMRQSQDFARRQPAVFLGGAVATGFMLARFLHSSGQRSEADYRPAGRGETASSSSHSQTATTLGPSSGHSNVGGPSASTTNGGIRDGQ